MGENTLYVAMYELIFSFRTPFLRVSKRKNGDFSLRGLFSRFLHDYLSKCPNSKKPPLSKKIPGYAPAKRYFNSDYRKLKNFFSCHKHLFHLLHFVTSNYFHQILIFSNEKSRTRAKGRVI